MIAHPTRRGFLGRLAALALSLLGARRLPAAAPAPTPPAAPPVPRPRRVAYIKAPPGRWIATFHYDAMGRFLSADWGPDRGATFTYDANPPAPDAET